MLFRNCKNKIFALRIRPGLHKPTALRNRDGSCFMIQDAKY
ncbi:Uncharacterized protein dnm_040150 [Desulfonema magnum]|uniref:Uncharacterized protein n=1 Tax=Desulfonema magnum TaxID=45655 RepID=A0A975GNN7_9BACT|nr:Uncharacterized protein dnm_040150 [Desulfonema magnum]